METRTVGRRMYIHNVTKDIFYMIQLIITHLFGKQANTDSIVDLYQEVNHLFRFANTKFVFRYQTPFFFFSPCVKLSLVFVPPNPVPNQYSIKEVILVSLLTTPPPPENYFKIGGVK